MRAPNSPTHPAHPTHSELEAWLQDSVGLSGRKLGVAIAQCDAQLVEQVGWFVLVDWLGWLVGLVGWAGWLGLAGGLGSGLAALFWHADWLMDGRVGGRLSWCVH